MGAVQKSIAIQISILSIIVGGVTLAVSFPTSTPTGQTAGGKFMQYFNNMKGSKNCDDGEAVVGFNSDFTKICKKVVATAITYSWDTSGAYGTCSKTCGGGTQIRTVTCKGSDGTTVSDSYCSGTKPSTSQTCNTGACAPTYTYSWNSSSFGSCSVSCGGGTQTRTVTCKRIDGTSVADSFCIGTKPATSQTCNTGTCYVPPSATSKITGGGYCNPLETVNGCGAWFKWGTGNSGSGLCAAGSTPSDIRNRSGTNTTEGIIGYTCIEVTTATPQYSGGGYCNPISLSTGCTYWTKWGTGDSGSGLCAAGSTPSNIKYINGSSGVVGYTCS